MGCCSRCIGVKVTDKLVAEVVDFDKEDVGAFIGLRRSSCNDVNEDGGCIRTSNGGGLDSKGVLAEIGNGWSSADYAVCGNGEPGGA